MTEQQVDLIGPPADTVSFVEFSPDSTHILVGSWDSTTRMYDLNTNFQRMRFPHRAAVLTGTFHPDGMHAYMGGLEMQVREADLRTEAVRVLGKHDKALSAAVWSKETNALITGSWDRTLRAYDPRAATAQQASVTLPERVYRASVAGVTLVAALGSRLVHLYDVRNLGGGPTATRESSLKFMTRALAAHPAGSGFALGSVEGRVAVEYFEATKAEEQYAFKCHRAPVGDVDHVWPVNALAFHPTFHTFASGGADGTVSIWDQSSKKRLRQYPKYPAGVTALAFSPDGTKLALGTGYSWEEGAAGAAAAATTPTAVTIRTLGEEVKPKGWGGAA